MKPGLILLVLGIGGFALAGFGQSPAPSNGGAPKEEAKPVAIRTEPAPSPSKRMTVIIDPAHGGEDSGATSGGAFAKHLNFDVARRLEIQLQRRGFRTVMTRTRDELVADATRIATANKLRDAVLISIDFPKASSSETSGIEVFYHNDQSYPLAQRLSASLAKKLHSSEHRGTTRADFPLLQDCQCPAVVVTGGFMSNAAERERMMQPWYRYAMAESIATAIDKWKSELPIGE